VTEAEKALKVYDLLREAHKSIRQIWYDFPELNHRSEEGQLVETGFYDSWESAVDAVDGTLYLAEGFFVRQNIEAMGKPSKPK